MKTLFQYVGVLVFMCFAFFYTEKAVNVVKSMDEIMIKINEEKENYQISSLDAIITEDTMIPGRNGIVVDVNESYLQMKKVGSFEKNLFVFEEIEPNISINNIYDKYVISGNTDLKYVSLVFLVNDQDNVESILNSLKTKEVKATFFLDGKWMEENSLMAKQIANYGHEIENYGYEKEYNNDLMLWTNEVIKKISGKQSNYCHATKKDHYILDICGLYKMKTIHPNIISSVNPLSEVKKSLNKGRILSFEISENLNKELPSILNYIHQKGYEIVPLKTLLSEKRK